MVNGTVDLTDNNDGNDPDHGLDNTPSSNHYEFRDTQLSCESLTAQGIGGVYDVQAEGDTANINHQHTAKEEGETCGEGGSNKIDTDGDDVADEVHSGDLEAFQGGSRVINGKVHFVRLGTTVLADGPLWEDPNAQGDAVDHWFQAELEFIPAAGEECETGEVNTASLIGTGEIYAGSASHNCGDDAAKVDDKDC